VRDRVGGATLEAGTPAAPLAEPPMSRTFLSRPRGPVAPASLPLGLALLVGATACEGPSAGDLFGDPGAGGAGDGGASSVGASTGKGGSTSHQASSSQQAASTGTPSAISVTSVATTSSGTGCDPVAYYTCIADGACVPLAWACDSFSDCADGSDEAPLNPVCGGVTSTTTGGCEASCSDGTCIPASYLCDDVSDCSDGSDELGCDPVVPDGWRCSATFYGSDDGCDCGCGVLDPDCATPGVASCQYCNYEGSCATSCEEIDDDSNWLCD
jgi:hypothetical protein